MGGPGEIWQQAAENFDRHFRSIRDDQWDAPTPCPDWTVRDLVNHAAEWQARLGGQCGATATPGDDWPTVYAAVKTAVEDPSNLEGTVSSDSMGEMPKHQVLGIAAGDILLHGWDLARAIGADDTLPADAVRAVHMGMQRMPEEMLRSSGMFGPRVEVGDDADEQTKLLALTGRQRVT